MRASIGLLGGIVVLFIGIQALGQAGKSAEPAVNNSSVSTQAAYNMSTGIFEGIGAAASPAIVWGGIAAFILIALGLLVFATGGGR